MKYYFICYVWRAKNEKTENVFQNYILFVHPLQWLQQQRESDRSANICLVSWQEISEEEYKTATQLSEIKPMMIN